MQPYKTIVGVIELSNDKQPYGIVQQRYGIGSSTVTHIMKRFKELELSLDDLKKMEPGKVDPFHPVLTWNDQNIVLQHQFDYNRSQFLLQLLDNCICVYRSESETYLICKLQKFTRFAAKATKNY